MTKRIVSIIILVIMISCNNAEKANTKGSEIWVYLEMGSEKDLSNDAIYGKISEEHLNFIKDNSKSEKLVMISSGRYIDEKDSIIKDVSSNTNEKGVFFYKIKTINYLEILKEDPINTKVNIAE